MPRIEIKKNLLFPGLLLLGLALTLFSWLGDLPQQLEIMKIKVESPASFESKSFDQMLHKYVKYGLVDYAGLKKSTELAAAYEEIKRTNPAALKGKLEELCFWINSYHLLIIKNILDQYPTETMAPKSANARYVIGGKLYSLEQIKDEILPDLILSTDWRAVFLLCNGQMSAPELASHAYSPATISDDIDRAFKKFVLNEVNYHVDEQKKDFSLSPFYLWNYKFFSEKYSSAFQMVNEQFPEGKQLNLEGLTQSFTMPYDRRINDLALLAKAKEELLRRQKLEEIESKELEIKLPDPGSVPGPVPGPVPVPGPHHDAKQEQAINASDGKGGK